MSFADLIQLPQYTRKEQKRKKIFKSFWMTSEENFQIIEKIETETAEKEADQKEKENIKQGSHVALCRALCRYVLVLKCESIL